MLRGLTLLHAGLLIDPAPAVAMALSPDGRRAAILDLAGCVRLVPVQLQSNDSSAASTAAQVPPVRTLMWSDWEPSATSSSSNSNSDPSSNSSNAKAAATAVQPSQPTGTTAGIDVLFSRYDMSVCLLHEHVLPAQGLHRLMMLSLCSVCECGVI